MSLEEEEIIMKEVKVKWFGYMEPIDEDINTFLAKNLSLIHI